MMMRFFFACVVVLAPCLSDCVWAASGPRAVPESSRAQQSEPAYLGGLVSPPLPKPRFTLTDTFGAPFDFWSRTQGYVTLLFFGYARCPDQCPLHMENIAMGLKRLPPELDAQVRLVFVTTDPVRDTPNVLRSWLDRFDRRFVGLTGSETAIEVAQTAAGVPPARNAVRGGQDYAVGHANFVLAYTKDNLAHLIYPGG
jgi:protein SCO1/2